MTKISPANDNAELVHPVLIGAGAALLIAAFVTDLLYWRTLSSQWETFSIWLLAAGLIVAAVSGLALLAEARLGRVSQIAWRRFAGLCVAALLSLLNAFIHSRDGYTAVVPQGLALSFLVTALLLITGWHGFTLRAARVSHQSQQGKKS